MHKASCSICTHTERTITQNALNKTFSQCAPSLIGGIVCGALNTSVNARESSKNGSPCGTKSVRYKKYTHIASCLCYPYDLGIAWQTLFVVLCKVWSLRKFILQRMAYSKPYQ